MRTNNYKNLDRLHRARLVGQYHAREGLDSLQAFATWYNQLNAQERAFIHWYRNFGHDGALDPSDIRHLPLGERLKIKFEVSPASIKALNDALSLAAAAIGNAAPKVKFSSVFRNLSKGRIADGLIDNLEIGHSVSGSGQGGARK